MMFPDLTQVNVPFGLLDRETQEALKAHGGPYEYWKGIAWGDSASTTLFGIDPAIVYRVKPAPSKPREWWAVQKNGVHIGMWSRKEDAIEATRDYRGAEIIHVREVIPE